MSKLINTHFSTRKSRIRECCCCSLIPPNKHKVMHVFVLNYQEDDRLYEDLIVSLAVGTKRGKRVPFFHCFLPKLASSLVTG